MTGKKYVNIEQIELVGNYAVRIVFDDGHDFGIYAWEYLRESVKNANRSGSATSKN
jgi:DUF971 family protein